MLIMTDGQVMGTEAILARARSTGTRLHSLGIGSASQDRFLTLLAPKPEGSAGSSARVKEWTCPPSTCSPPSAGQSHRA